MYSILITLIVFHSDKLGKDIKEMHPENIKLKFIALLIFSEYVLLKYNVLPVLSV